MNVQQCAPYCTNHITKLFFAMMVLVPLYLVLVYVHLKYLIYSACSIQCKKTKLTYIASLFEVHETYEYDDMNIVYTIYIWMNSMYENDLTYLRAITEICGYEYTMIMWYAMFILCLMNFLYNRYKEINTGLCTEMYWVLDGNMNIYSIYLSICTLLLNTLLYYMQYLKWNDTAELIILMCVSPTMIYPSIFSNLSCYALVHTHKCKHLIKFHNYVLWPMTKGD